MLYMLVHGFLLAAVREEGLMIVSQSCGHTCDLRGGAARFSKPTAELAILVLEVL